MPKTKIPLLLIILTYLYLAPNTETYAQEPFETEYSVTYTISDIGEASILQKITITNTQNDIFATNHELYINQMSLHDIEGSDQDGRLEVDTDTENSTTKISTKFSNPVIGENRSYTWDLSYKSKDIATKVGEVWNIHIPQVESLDQTKSYDITLIVPKSLGPQIFVSPQPVTIQEENYRVVYKFDKERLENKGVTASFGTYQVLNFKLDYKLKNNSSFSSYQEVALPPNIRSRQQVAYFSLEPIPLDIYNDKDGNTLALFKVKPKSELNIQLIGSAKISGFQINPKFGGRFEEIPRNLIAEYTKADKYWEVNEKLIKDLGEGLLDKNLTVSQNAKKVYDYVTNNLKYDFEISENTSVDRRGALTALGIEGKWACMEFSDSFIAISRAMGVPARELNGYAYAKEGSLTPLSINLKSGDVLHSWAEYFDPNFGWVQVDPTWGNTSGIDYFTKLDTNHFVFVTKGVDSEYPFPAGTYKIVGTEKQVEVDIAQDFDEDSFKVKFGLYEVLSINPFQILKGRRKYIAKNEGNITVYNFAETGKELIPHQTLKVYLPKNSRQVYYEDFVGDGHYYNFTIKRGDPRRSKVSTRVIVVSFFLGLALCTTIYVLVIRKVSPKKVLRRLRLLRRGPNL